MSHSWKSGVNGDWNTASKWTNGVPTASSAALITASGTYIVSSSQGNDVETLEMQGGATLLINAHHIVCDGWSLEILLRELAAFYRSQSSGDHTPANLDPLPIQYGDYAAWQRDWLKTEGWRMLFGHQSEEENASSRASLGESLGRIPGTLERLL